jgi:hypothetical protein
MPYKEEEGQWPERALGKSAVRRLALLLKKGTLRSSVPRCVRRLGVADTAAQDALHLVFQVQFFFFQRDFFDVFGGGEVGAFRVVVEPFVEIVVPGGELAELLVALQELPLHFFEVSLHLRPPLRSYVNSGWS